MPAPFAIPARCFTCAWLRGCVPVWWLGFAAVAGGMSLVSLWRWSSSTCLRVFVVVVWLVFVGGLGGIATIGAALRRVVGVSGVYGRKTPVVAWMGQRRVLFRWLCWSCSACLCVFVVVVWLVFVGGLGGIATIGAALRRVAGVSGVYGRKTPRVVARMGQRRVPVEGSMVLNLPCACSKCSPPRWNAGDMGCLGCSGLRFGRGGSW